MRCGSVHLDGLHLPLAFLLRRALDLLSLALRQLRRVLGLLRRLDDEVGGDEVQSPEKCARGSFLGTTDLVGVLEEGSALRGGVGVQGLGARLNTVLPSRTIKGRRTLLRESMRALRSLVPMSRTTSACIAASDQPKAAAMRESEAVEKGAKYWTTARERI
jgi:hypothetical protein